MNNQWLKWFSFFILTVIWSACSNDKDFEIIDSESILPQAQGQYDYSEDTSQNEEVEISPFEEHLKQSFPDINFKGENTLEKREMLFMPDRLGYTEKNETYFTHDSIPFHLIEWTFKDSLKTVNAFYNWLDCFGHKCKSIRIDEEKNGSKEAFVVWISNTKITYLASIKSINRRIWQKAIFDLKENNWNYVIHQAPHGKINWTVSASQKEIKKPVKP
ncbi:MAG TPA: hypothetical protein VFD77_00745 [Brumimicrobium sp.]|nr:hypothetical protein [Brumimicrobium sp.]